MPAPTAHDFKQNLNDGALRDIVAVSPELSLNSHSLFASERWSRGRGEWRRSIGRAANLPAKLLKSGCF